MGHRFLSPVLSYQYYAPLFHRWWWFRSLKVNLSLSFSGMILKQPAMLLIFLGRNLPVLTFYCYKTGTFLYAVWTECHNEFQQNFYRYTTPDNDQGTRGLLILIYTLLTSALLTFGLRMYSRISNHTFLAQNSFSDITIAGKPLCCGEDPIYKKYNCLPPLKRLSAFIFSMSFKFVA